MSGPGERRRVVDLYSATPMAAARVAERLGYPTGQCLECRPAKDPGYAGHMAKSIIPLETGTKAIEPVPGSMRRKRAAELLGAGVGAVHDRVKAYRGGRCGRVAARKQELRPTQNTDCFASMFVRQVRQCFSVVWADGFPRCRHRFPVM